MLAERYFKLECVLLAGRKCGYAEAHIGAVAVRGLGPAAHHALHVHGGRRLRRHHSIDRICDELAKGDLVSSLTEPARECLRARE